MEGVGEMGDGFDALSFSTQGVVVVEGESKGEGEEEGEIGVGEDDEVVYIFGTTEEPFMCELNVSLPCARFNPVPLSLKLYSYQGGIFLTRHHLLLFGGI